MGWIERLAEAERDLSRRLDDLVEALLGTVPIGRRVDCGPGLRGGGGLDRDIALALAASGVTPGSYTLLSGTVDTYGRLTAAASGSLPASGVTPGSYTLSSITVSSDGRITAASNGSGGSSTVQQLRWSPVNRIAQRGITPTYGAGAFTYGTLWIPTRALTITGIRFWWGAGAVSVTCKLWLPDGSVGASKTVVTTGVAGIFTATFTTPYVIAAGDLGKHHFTTVYDGAHYNYNDQGESQQVYPLVTRSTGPIQAGPWIYQMISAGISGFYRAGDDIPNYPDSADAFVEPIIADDLP